MATALSNSGWIILGNPEGDRQATAHDHRGTRSSFMSIPLQRAPVEPEVAVVVTETWPGCRAGSARRPPKPVTLPA